MHEILGPLLPGVALDAACGTGRYTEYLAGRGHQVIGVDSSPDMLAHARTRVPNADLRQGDLHLLPVPDDHVDIVVCALALTHLPDVGPAITEFARVLRPGGHLVITDVHHELVALGSVPRVRSAGAIPGCCPRSGTGPVTISAPPCRWGCGCGAARSRGRPPTPAGTCPGRSRPDRGTSGPGRCWASSRRPPAPPGTEHRASSSGTSSWRRARPIPPPQADHYSHTSIGLLASPVVVA